MKKTEASASHKGAGMSKNIKNPDIKAICEEAPVLVESFLNKKPECITCVTKEGDEWKVQVEVMERKAVPDTQDILITYELKLTGDLEFTGYRRVGMRHRGDMIVEEKEI
ncbi:Gas vesicle synthesis protein GvpO [uncultured archaeon]|nr:Gas vesicle synthesis protein GvpO [uncultured archaeon]